MKLFGDAKVLQGSVAWASPFRVRFTPNSPASEAAVPQAVPEYDEDGRLFVFRYAGAKPQQYTIERDRIFDYMKRRRLPRESHRQYRRDFRNRVDFFADVRDLTWQSEVAELRPEPVRGIDAEKT